MQMNIQDLIKLAKDKKGSDLHLVAGVPPLLRIDGELKPFAEFGIMTAEDVERLFHQLANIHLRDLLKSELEVDFAHELPGGGRGRCNACWQQGSISLAIRILSDHIPSVEEIGLPDIAKELITRPRGLILVTGTTGSGKSTTIAAMFSHLNHSLQRYVVTIEDPIEYIHPGIKCAFSQRELDQDTHSFVNALKYVLRQDPDVILVGEMRDLETASAVLTVAETGHLVLGSLHTTSAMKTIDRIVNVFPPEQQTQIRMQLAGTLQGIVAQTLVPKIAGGRIAALEILVATDAVRAMIRESKMAQLVSTMQTGKKYGMQVLEDHLNELVASKTISYEQAVEKANSPDTIRRPGGVPRPVGVGA